jgi:hypothetical protein
VRRKNTDKHPGKRETVFSQAVDLACEVVTQLCACVRAYAEANAQNGASGAHLGEVIRRGLEVADVVSRRGHLHFGGVTTAHFFLVVRLHNRRFPLARGVGHHAFGRFGGSCLFATFTRVLCTLRMKVEPRRGERGDMASRRVDRTSSQKRTHPPVELPYFLIGALALETSPTYKMLDLSSPSSFFRQPSEIPDAETPSPQPHSSNTHRRQRACYTHVPDTHTHTRISTLTEQDLRFREDPFYFFFHRAFLGTPLSHQHGR